MKEIERIPAHECLGEEEDAEEMGSFRNESREEGTTVCERAFSAKAAVKPAVSTNVRNIYLHELNPAYTL